MRVNKIRLRAHKVGAITDTPGSEVKGGITHLGGIWRPNVVSNSQQFLYVNLPYPLG